MVSDCLRSRFQTHLCFIESSVNLPEIFSEEVFPDWLSVDPNPLPDLHQMWRAAHKRAASDTNTSTQPVEPTLHTCTPPHHQYDHILKSFRRAHKWSLTSFSFPFSLFVFLFFGEACMSRQKTKNKQTPQHVDVVHTLRSGPALQFGRERAVILHG